MAKKAATPKTSRKSATPKPTKNDVGMANAEAQRMSAQAYLGTLGFIENEYTSRRQFLEQLLNPGKDINYECGYPASVSIQDYHAMFEREGLATRVVSVLPEESWAVSPEIYENEDPSMTAFEEDMDFLIREKRLFHYMERIDIISGIGRYGILVLGINDGKKLSEPADGIDLKTGEITGAGKKRRELLYMKPLDESVVTITKKETDATSPRFGFPVTYSIQLEDYGMGSVSTKLDVHWTRVIHLADNRQSSEFLGTPRMLPVYNRLLDIRKIMAGSGEMFWKGGYPGLAFKLDPNISAANATIDKVSLKEEMEKYAAGMQRWLALEGVTVENLPSHVADPAGHVKVQVQYVAITLGIPTRILLGSEEARLASNQDTRTWNKRIAKRQQQYLSLLVLRPMVDRLIALGVVTAPKDNQYEVSWPDLQALDSRERAEVAKLITTALADYVAGNVDMIIPPKEYLTMILGFDEQETSAISEASLAYVSDVDAPDERDAETPPKEYEPPPQDMQD